MGLAVGFTAQWLTGWYLVLATVVIGADPVCAVDVRW
jgi:hypothetical protein